MSAVFGILCVLLIVLWVRSYNNSSSWPSPVAEAGDFAYYSTPGLMIVARAPFVKYDRSGDVSHSYFIPHRFQGIGGGYWIGAQRWGLLGFNGGFWSRWNWVLQVPYWFAVATAVTIAAAPWLHWKFSLRTLQIATTLIAVVLGLVVSRMRS